MSSSLASLLVLAAAVVQTSGFADRWSRNTAFYQQRLNDAGIAGSSLVFVKDGAVVGMAFDFHCPSRSGYIVSFNTNGTSKSDPRRTTRAVDNDLRDLMIRELFQEG